MSSKGKQGAAKAKKPAKSGGESKTEDVLQAVLLADSFQDRFKPLTIEQPRCLLPLANTPLIEYTLEFLAMNDVKEVFIYCGNHTDQVEDYINTSRWALSSGVSPFSNLQFVRVSDAKSVGDVLRDMDSRSWIKGDFVLVHGDVVSNIMLDETLAAHRRRREESAANMMTCVLTSGGAGPHATKSHGIEPLFVIDDETQRLLHYEEVHHLVEGRRALYDETVFELSSGWEARTDLIDPEIDICTPEVLALWSESFDYELPRKNFLHGVLKDWELNGKVVYAAVLQGYAARASNLQMYEAITRNVLGRWTAPFIPERNLLPKHQYRPAPGGMVMEAIKQGPSLKMSKSVIGQNTAIAGGCSITDSVIGTGCTIGPNVVLHKAVIWDNVSIGQGATVTRSLVAANAAIGNKCVISEGTVVSFNAVIGDGITTPENTLITCVGADGKPASKDTALLGTSTNACQFVDDEEEEEDQDPSAMHKTLIYQNQHLNASATSISTFASDDDLDSDDDEVLGEFDSDDDEANEVTGNIASFHADAVHGLQEELRNPTGDFDSAKLEFMGLRLSNNASDTMMRRAVATAFANRGAELLAPEFGAHEPAKAAEKAIRGAKGASKFLEEVGVGGEEKEQAEFVLELQKALRNVTAAPSGADARKGTLLAAMLQQLYMLDILEEDGILGWWGDGRAGEGEGMAELRDKCRALVEWLENADEEDSDEDSD